MDVGGGKKNLPFSSALLLKLQVTGALWNKQGCCSLKAKFYALCWGQHHFGLGGGLKGFVYFNITTFCWLTVQVQAVHNIEKTALHGVKAIVLVQ